MTMTENEIKSNPTEPEVVDDETNDNNHAIIQHASIIETYSGPLPPPDDLKKYNEAAPDAAERIIKMAENEQQHRHDKEKKAIDISAKFERQGQWFGFIISIVSLIGGFIMIYFDKTGIGTLFGVGGISSLIFPFFRKNN